MKTSQHRAAPQGRSARVMRRHKGSKAATDAERARVIANRYIVLQYPFGVLGGTPCRVTGQNGAQWIVPVILTSPGVGPVGLVGMVAVDVTTGAVVAATPRDEVATEGQRVREEKGDGLEAAFLQTREV